MHLFLVSRFLGIEYNIISELKFVEYGTHNRRLVVQEPFLMWAAHIYTNVIIFYENIHEHRDDVIPSN